MSAGWNLRPEDIIEIIERSATIMGLKYEIDGLAQIAERCRGTPRVANRLLRRVRDYAEVVADG